MNANSRKSDTIKDSISGNSAALFITEDDSLAALLQDDGINVRDFILLSFLSDQGPMSALRLAQVVGIEPEKTLIGLEKLSAANLIIRNPASSGDSLDSIAQLTTRGESIATRVNNQRV